MSMPYEPVVEELVELIRTHQWDATFQEAVAAAHQSGVVEMRDVKTTADYLDFINGLLRWIPSENVQGKDIYNHLCKFYFVLDQHPVRCRARPRAALPGIGRGVHVYHHNTTTGADWITGSHRPLPVISCAGCRAYRYRSHDGRSAEPRMFAR